jgi:hypothetical protein
MRTLLLVASALAVSGSAVELTKANFDKEVKQSGKNAFIKFLAPWCAARHNPLAALPVHRMPLAPDPARCGRGR